MKNKIINILLSIFLTTTLFAQDWETAVDPSPGFASVNEAAHMAKRIVDAAGVEANFKIAEARVPNALAVLHGGKRYILYNPKFISLLTILTGTKWSAISVLAHEIGHHLHRSSVNRGKLAMATELEADEFSGYVLHKMGATEDEAEAAIQLLASERASRTHPGRDDRINSIAKGWRKADNENITGDIARTAPGKVQHSIDPSPDDQSVLLAKDILAAVRFNADPGVKYYLTTRLNVVRVDGDKLYIIGKLIKSDNKTYPYVIYDESDTRVFVKSTGDIVSNKGSIVGRMIAHES